MQIVGMTPDQRTNDATTDTGRRGIDPLWETLRRLTGLTH